MDLTLGFGFASESKRQSFYPEPSLCTDVQQSYRDTSITEEADIPISALTVASTDLTAQQLEDMLTFFLSFFFFFGLETLPLSPLLSLWPCILSFFLLTCIKQLDATSHKGFL